MVINTNDENIKLIDLIQALKNGEEVFIVTNDKTFKIVEVEEAKKYRKFGTAKGQFRISDDFNAPVDDFKEYEPQYGSAEGLIEMSDDFDEPLQDFKNYSP